MEVNERLDTEPNMVVTHHGAEGYIAIAMPVHLGSDLTDKGRLLNWEQYSQLAKKEAAVASNDEEKAPKVEPVQLS